VDILTAHQLGQPLAQLEPCVELAEIRRLQVAVRTVRTSAELKRYIVEIVRATRCAEGVRLGASPRAGLALMQCAQALAVLDGFDFVTPDAIRETAVPAVAHRLVLDPQARFSGLTAEAVVRGIVERLPVPA
jgi:MoxR-like ATPase